MDVSPTKSAKRIGLIGPDLRKLAPLSEYLARLDELAHDAAAYAHEYNSITAELSTGDADGMGCTLMWSNDDPDDAEPIIYGGFIACDEQGELRRHYADALHEHAGRPNGFRDELKRLLLSRGHFSDNRRVDRKELFQAVGAMLDRGGSILIRPNGQFEHKPRFPFEAKSDDEADQILEAGRHYLRLAQRWRSKKALTRIVSMLGERTSNGWQVLNGRGA